MLIFGACCIFKLSFVNAEDLPIPSLHNLIDKGAYALQIPGEKRRSFNINSLLIPASTIKVLTGLMALEFLGPGYRFTTYLYKDEYDNLYVKGEGDPFLTSEAIDQIAQKLKQLKIERIRTLIFDSSAYSLERGQNDSAATDNPYDAQSAALAVNFNTISFIVTKEQKVISGEKQTPLLPMMKNLSSIYPEGRHRVNVNYLPAVGKFTNTIRYCGELFTAILKRQGIIVTNGYTTGQPPSNTDLLIAYNSDKTVSDLVRLCLQYSTNFIANQLFLACGSKLFGDPANWKKATMAAQVYISRQLNLNSSEIWMVDGSGLSTENRINASAMLTVLDKFRPYAELLPKQKSIYVKSGTLSNVYSFVGYFDDSQGLSPFVIFLNQKRNTRGKILQFLEKEYLSITKSP